MFTRALTALCLKPTASVLTTCRPLVSQQRPFATTVDIPVKAITPLPSHIQAWIRSFETNELIDIVLLDRTVFGAPRRVDILHRVVVWQRDNLRQGTASTKGRSDVRGRSGKLAPQKGRGKARVGSVRAPHRRGGGIAFGPKPRDHSTKLPHKMQDMGLRVALSVKYAQNQLIVVDSLQLETHKTKDLHLILRRNWAINKDSARTMLFVTGTECAEYENLERASRTLRSVGLLEAGNANVLSLLKYELVVVDKEAVKKLEKLLRVGN